MSFGYIWAKALKKLRGSAIANSDIHATAKVEAGSHVVKSIIGRHSFCGYDCSIIHCTIGSFCCIANHVSIGGPSHPINFVSMSPVFLAHRDSVPAKFSRHVYEPFCDTTIGNDVWIGERALIKAGVRIGHGAVVGMGSVVTRDVSPYEIVAGNPAKVIRMRFDDVTIGKLLARPWWDLSDDRLRSVAIHFNDVDAYLKACE